MEQRELETIFNQNDNHVQGLCFMPEPDQLEVPIRADFMHIEDNPDLENNSLTFRWLEN